MTLPFSTKFADGTPTHFAEKIMSGLVINDIITGREPKSYEYIMHSDFDSRVFLASPPKVKLHTIRADKNNRWKEGNKIHGYYHSRTAKMRQIFPVIECVAVQKIEIEHTSGFANVAIGGKHFGEIYHHGLHDIYEYTNDLETLAHNDGFDSVKSFFQYFNHGFTGKIIHWTNLKY